MDASRDNEMIDARGLVKRFYDKGTKRWITALKGIDVEVCSGSLTAVVGPDGAGKTTLLRLLAGLMAPDEGVLTVLGHTLFAEAQAVQNRISYMPQQFGLYEDLSIQENMELYADLHGVTGPEREARFSQLLEMTDLERFRTRPAGKLSGGMKQKLGLACTLVRSPELLLLDEPTVGVDPLSRRELWAIVQQLVESEGLTVVVTTAYMDEAERSDNVYVMHEGEVLASGTASELRQLAAGRCYDVMAPDTVKAAQLLDYPSILDASPQGRRIHFICRDNVLEADVIKRLSPAEPVASEPTIEDAFIVLLKRTGAGEEAPPIPQTPADTHAVDDEAVIRVNNLVRKFGDFTAVASTSFEVKRGEIFGLLGPNGAGKTTTFRMLCGLLPATSGELYVAGRNLRTARASARRRVGYVAQKFALYRNLTVYENLRFFGSACGLSGRKLKDRIAAVLDEFDLASHRRTEAGTLPGGFKQRMAMAAALVHEPDILFLDEPTSGADPLARRGFWKRITALAATGTTVIITTHFLEEAEYCDRILIQDAGERLAIGTPNEVRSQAGCDPDDSMEQAFIAIIEQNRKQEAVA